MNNICMRCGYEIKNCNCENPVTPKDMTEKLLEAEEEDG